MFVAATMICLRPEARRQGAAQLLFSSRSTRQISLPVALSSATRNDSPSWSKRAAAGRRRARGHAFAKGHPHPHLDAEVLLPDERALQVVDVDPARPEEREDVLAVGDGRVGGEAAVGRVEAFMGRGGRGRALPESWPVFRSRLSTSNRCSGCGPRRSAPAVGAVVPAAAGGGAAAGAPVGLPSSGRSGRPTARGSSCPSQGSRSSTRRSVCRPR